MRQISLRTAAALVLILPALATNAAAQQKREQGGGAPAVHAAPPAPHVAAPAAAPHIAAPAPQPHIAAQPHVAAPAPHIAAPAPHVAAPAHVAAPTHVATPHVATPQIAHTNAGHPSSATAVTRQHGNAAITNSRAAARRGAPTPTSAASSKVVAPSKTNAATTAVTGPNKAGPNTTVPNTGAPNTAASKLATPSKTTPNTAAPNTTAPNAVGQGAGNRGRNAVNQQAQAQAQAQAKAQARAQIYAGGRKPILQNQSFANGATRDPALRTLARSTFQGGFSQFGFGDRFAQRRGFHGIVIGWVGPVFWPYAYQDFVDYTFWPYGNDAFWPYAYDDVYDGIFGGYAPDVTAYASVPTRGRREATRGPAAAGLPAAGSAQVCSGQASGLTDWPVERIAQQVQPDEAQRALLDQLRDATAKAVNLLQSACPTDLPDTPTGRLTEMRQRIQSMLQAVQLVRPALDKFYQSLNDEQKQRFNALDSASSPAARNARSATRRQPDLTQVCSNRAAQPLPTSRIEQNLRLDDSQRAALQSLNTASARAAELMSQNCPQDQSLTPTGRVAAIEQRLNAMLQALDTVQPAMASFYNSLSDEQKARFNRLPRQA